MQIDGKQGSYYLNLDADNSIIIGDQTHLGNTIYNLVDNAIKYSNGRPEISIQTFNNNRSLVVVFTDNGIGIDKKYQSKIFEKFYRVPTGDVHDVKGFGIGLAYIKKIIDLHGGTIKCDSEDKGTAFIITLPNA